MYHPFSPQADNYIRHLLCNGEHILTYIKYIHIHTACVVDAEGHKQTTTPVNIPTAYTHARTHTVTQTYTHCPSTWGKDSRLVSDCTTLTTTHTHPPPCLLHPRRHSTNQGRPQSHTSPPWLPDVEMALQRALHLHGCHEPGTYGLFIA